MKGLFCFLFVFILTNNVIGQNWNLININYKYNYKDESLGYITNTQYADSVKLIGLDSVFYMKPTAYSIANDSFLVKNAPQFLQKNIRKTAAGAYLLSDTARFVIYPSQIVGYSWLFDTIQNINATIVSISAATNFGVSDSEKIIVLSSNDSIIISKQFGIKNFSKPGINKYKLVGINETNYGEQVPWEGNIFDYGIGDIFYYEGQNLFPPQSTSYASYRVKILGKQIFADSVSYMVNELGYYKGYPYPLSYFNFTRNVTYSKYFNRFSNYYNGLVVGTNNIEHYGYLVGSCFILKDTLCMVMKYNYEFFNAMQTKNTTSYVYNYKTNTDTLILSQYMILLMGFEYEYKNNLGCTNYNLNNFECHNDNKLIGYIKGSDTVGTWLPDSAYYKNASPDGIIDVEKDVKKMSIYKSSSSGIYSVNLNFTPAKEDRLELFNINGQLIKVQAATIREIDLHNLPIGVYLLKYFGSKLNLVQRLVNI